MLGKNEANGIIIKCINHKAEINKARQLLYDVYIDEMQWKPLASNPSQIKIIENSYGQFMLADRFDDIAIWFGAYEREKLVGCMRGCRPDNEKMLEVEYYPSFKGVAHLNKKVSGDKLFEVTRAAIHKDYRKKSIHSELMEYVLNYCLKHELSIVTATSAPVLKKKYAELEMRSSYSFKYEERDQAEAHLYVINFIEGEVKKILENLQHYKNKALHQNKKKSNVEILLEKSSIFDYKDHGLSNDCDLQILKKQNVKMPISTINETSSQTMKTM